MQCPEVEAFATKIGTSAHVLPLMDTKRSVIVKSVKSFLASSNPRHPCDYFPII